ncbi:MAG: hypothetical protein LBS25_08790 [Candidatus Symbiothrix sp.]|jgi:hypothetical protein|nr:hypothetical protein [Candidatus Symbiothrix sp.]
MSSTVETGISVYVGHFQKLIDVCESFEKSYNPFPRDLRIESLKLQLSGVQAAIDAVDMALPTMETAENARRQVFTQMPPLATRVQATAIISGLPDSIVLHIKEVVRKIHGSRAKAIKPEMEGEKHISVSQVSFNAQIEHFNQLIYLVDSQPAYKPSESGLKVDALKKLLNEMRATNDAAMAANIPLKNARIERDRLLYAPDTGMMNTALRVKEYVKAVFGTASPQYEIVRHISFHNR